MRISRVVDASVLVALLVDGQTQEAARAAVADTDLVIPHLADAEVLSGLRSLWLDGTITDAALERAAGDLGTMPATRVAMRGLHHRVAQLRHNLTAYDATYVALAEALDVTLLTFDGRMARAPGPRCEVVLVGA